MKLIHLLLTIALIVPIVGCGTFSLDDPKVANLEARVAKLEEQAEQWKKANTRLQNEKASVITQYNDLVTMNRALIAEKRDLAEENEELRNAVDALKIVIAKIDEDPINVENATAWPPTTGDKISFKINFDHGKLYNKRESKAIAGMVLSYAKVSGGNVKITVEGYSSKAGPAKLNKWFSKERAEGVMHKIYEAHNNGPLNLEVIAHGETDDDERKVIVTVEVL